ALLTRACSLPSFRRLRISATARWVSAASARSTWIWSSGPAAQGQFSGKAWREQVMTRQPALEKRFTVAWPIPREAPVRIRVRFSSSIWTGLLVSVRSLPYHRRANLSYPQMHDHHGLTAIALLVAAAVALGLCMGRLRLLAAAGFILVGVV